MQNWPVVVRYWVDATLSEYLPTLMPFPIYYAHRLVQRQSEVRRDGCAVRPRLVEKQPQRILRIDVHRVRRHLQRPGARRTRLQNLQHHSLIGVGARHVGLQQPLGIGGSRHERFHW